MCATQYQNNHCNTPHMAPAMVSQCSNWETCMNRDPTTIGRARVSAELIAEVINGFVEPISWKTLVRVCNSGKEVQPKGNVFSLDFHLDFIRIFNCVHQRPSFPIPLQVPTYCRARSPACIFSHSPRHTISSSSLRRLSVASTNAKLESIRQADRRHGITYEKEKTRQWSRGQNSVTTYSTDDCLPREACYKHTSILTMHPSPESATFKLIKLSHWSSYREQQWLCVSILSVTYFFISSRSSSSFGCGQSGRVAQSASSYPGANHTLSF